MTGNHLPFNILDSVDSTNNYAMGMVKSGAWGDKQAVFAREQTAGKGQRGKHWKSERNANILMSFVVDAGFLPVRDQFGLSVAAALACVSLLVAHNIPDVKIKWPNDIYIGDRKAGGILIETIIQGSSLKWAVVGVGLNVNQVEFDPALSNPVSLRMVTGKEYDVEWLGMKLCDMFYGLIERLRSVGMDLILKEYNILLFKRCERVRLGFAGSFIETEVKGVASDGRLCTIDSIPRSFGWGEVKWEL